MDLKQYLKERRGVVDAALQRYLPTLSEPSGELARAMRYSLFAGGKRIRPILCIAGSEAVGGGWEEALPVGCALEMIHTYSLIHDDLPAMDDDDLRRGKPTNHTVFGEAMAVLAGDALLTEAFRLITEAAASDRVAADTALAVVGVVAEAAGHHGMVGGQAVDVQSEGRQVDLETVEFIHRRKTAALISASVRAGAMVGGGDRTQVEALAEYGTRLGLAFQISDDILDVEGDPRVMGKPTGSDENRSKATYPSVLGVAKSKTVQSELVASAVAFLEPLGPPAEPLKRIARYVIEREK